MSRIHKYIFIISALILVALGVRVFLRPTEEDERFLRDANRPVDRRALGKTASEPDVAEYVASTDESRTKMQEYLEVFRSNDEDKLADAILDMGGLGTEELLDLAQSYKYIRNPDYRRDVINLLQNVPHRRALLILADAMDDKDAGVRQEAISALSSAEEALRWEAEKAAKGKSDYNEMALKLEEADIKEIKEAVVQAVNDENEEVRNEAMNNMSHLSGDLQYTGLMAAIESENVDIRKEALFLIAGNYNKDTVEVVMKALDDRVEEIRNDASSFLTHILDQEFKSTKEAEAWWNKNSHKYDYDLVEQQEDDEK